MCITDEIDKLKVNLFSEENLLSDDTGDETGMDELDIETGDENNHVNSNTKKSNRNTVDMPETEDNKIKRENVLPLTNQKEKIQRICHDRDV